MSKRATNEPSKVGTKTVILRYMKDHGQVTRDDLIGFLGMTHQNISYHLGSLEKAGFVSRIQQTRPQIWCLTEKGRVIFTMAPFEENVAVILPLMFGLIQFTIVYILLFFIPQFDQNPLFFALLGGLVLSFSIGLIFTIVRFRTKRKNNDF